MAARRPRWQAAPVAKNLSFGRFLVVVAVAVGLADRFYSILSVQLNCNERTAMATEFAYKSNCGCILSMDGWLCVIALCEILHAKSRCKANLHSPAKELTAIRYVEQLHVMRGCRRPTPITTSPMMFISMHPR